MIEQIYNKNEVVQTSMAANVDGTIVHYRQCKNFAYEFWVYGVYTTEGARELMPWLTCSVESAKAAIDKMVSAMCNQSRDQGAEWVETYREDEFGDVTRYAIYSVRVSFKMREVL